MDPFVWHTLACARRNRDGVLQLLCACVCVYVCVRGGVVRRRRACMSCVVYTVIPKMYLSISPMIHNDDSDVKRNPAVPPRSTRAWSLVALRG